MLDKSDINFIQEFLIIIGKNIIRWRGIKKISQEELRIRAGVSRSTVSNIENGRSIELDNLLKIAYALDINPADLFLSDKDRTEITYKLKLLLEKFGKGFYDLA